MHENIQLTYEVKSNEKLPFLDVLLMQNNEGITATLYRKWSNSDVNLQLDSFTPISWKRGTLKTLVERAYLICSAPRLLEKELNHIGAVFRNTNGLRNSLINQINVKQRNSVLNSNVSSKIEVRQISNQTIVEKHDGKKTAP